MANLYLARFLGPDGFEKLVAIKKIHEHLTTRQDFVNMFKDEARLAARISHPNVAQVIELGQVDNSYFIAMEYVEGESLTELVKKTQVPYPIAARIISDALAGLQAAHTLCNNQGELLHVVHRDLSPSNILISYEGSVKVVDFGVAKARDNLHDTNAGTVKGKFAYMSPEQVREEKVDHRADLFAIGILLFETTTRRGLFRADSPAGSVAKISKGQFPPPSAVIKGYPPDLEKIVLKALEGKKEARYQSAKEMQEALEAFIFASGSPVTAAQVGELMRRVFADRYKMKRLRLRDKTLKYGVPTPIEKSAAPPTTRQDGSKHRTTAPRIPTGPTEKALSQSSPLSDNKRLAPAPDKRLAAPAPDKRLAPAPDKRLAAPAPDKRLAPAPDKRLAPGEAPGEPAPPKTAKPPTPTKAPEAPASKGLGAPHALAAGPTETREDQPPPLPAIPSSPATPPPVGPDILPDLPAPSAGIMRTDQDGETDLAVLLGRDYWRRRLLMFGGGGVALILVLIGGWMVCSDDDDVPLADKPTESSVTGDAKVKVRPAHDARLAGPVQDAGSQSVRTDTASASDRPPPDVAVPDVASDQAPKKAPDQAADQAAGTNRPRTNRPPAKPGTNRPPAKPPVGKRPSSKKPAGKHPKPAAKKPTKGLFGNPY
jgi:serine/threonine-protein kinase